MMIFEPKWKSLIVNTIEPLFTPEQCQDIINVGLKQKIKNAEIGSVDKDGTLDTQRRITKISWIPFKTMPQMYRIIENTMMQVNRNHFGYDGMQITEAGQFTEYPKGGFYDWHMDSEIDCKFEPPVRKISMTILLSNPNEFEGGDLEFMIKGNKLPQLVQGQAVFFCSLIRHRVNKITKGMRRSLVMWFGGTPLR